MNKSLFAFLLLSPLLACGKTVSLEDRACPCASGWVCCSNVCVEGTSCGSQPQHGAVVPPGGDADASTTPTPVKLASAQSARCLAFDAAHVYWQNADGLVVGAPKAGGAIEVSHFSTPTASNPRCGIAIDGDELFTTSYQLGKLIRLSLTSNGDWSIGASGTFWGTGIQHPSSIAVDPDWVYVTDYDGGAVLKISRSNTEAPAITLASGLHHPDDISLDGDYVFWLERGDLGAHNGHMRHVSRNGGEVLGDEVVLESPTHAVVRDHWWILSSDNGDIGVSDVYGTIGVGWYGAAIGAVAFDGTYVYWAASDGIRREHAFASDPRRFRYPTWIGAMAVDDVNIYFVAEESVFAIDKNLPHQDP